MQDLGGERLSDIKPRPAVGATAGYVGGGATAYPAGEHHKVGKYMWWWGGCLTVCLGLC